MRIIFFGTPGFAVPSLEMLHRSSHEVVGVVTAVDKPAGRGRTLRPSAVKAYAEAHGLPILQPLKLKDPTFLQNLRDLAPDLMVVVAFRKLPKLVWEIPRKGTFNLHSSLLPDYRGAAPINWVVINGETSTGLTTFMIDEKIDTGEILMRKKVDIPLEWTAGMLHDDLKDKGADLVLETVNGLDNGQLVPQPQDHTQFLHPAPKIFPDDCRINWNRSAKEIYNFVRGLSPYPTAWTELNEKSIKIFFVEISEEKTDQAPGTLRTIAKPPQLEVASKDCWVSIKSLQLSGKKRMEVNDFLNGYKGDLIKLV